MFRLAGCRHVRLPTSTHMYTYNQATQPVPDTGSQSSPYLKCLMSPCTGQAAASPSAQMVCPSICVGSSNNNSAAAAAACQPWRKRDAQTALPQHRAHPAANSSSAACRVHTHTPAAAHTAPPPHLLGDLPQHVNLLHARVPLGHARHDVIQPASALTAGRALTTRLVLVKVGQPESRVTEEAGRDARM